MLQKSNQSREYDRAAKLTASKRAASSISPATPLKQSTYAIFICPSFPVLHPHVNPRPLVEMVGDKFFFREKKGTSFTSSSIMQ